MSVKRRNHHNSDYYNLADDDNFTGSKVSGSKIKREGRESWRVYSYLIKTSKLCYNCLLIIEKKISKLLPIVTSLSQSLI